MRTNQLKAKMARGEAVAGIWLLANDPHVIGVCAEAGFDYVMLDREHTTLETSRLELLVRCCDAAGICPIARVPSEAKPDILPVLEAGVQGIMVPQIETAAQAEEVVANARFHPQGRRGMYWINYNSGYGALPAKDYYPAVNRELLVCVQIESARGAENAAEIAATPGIDCLFIGPSDLSQSFGVPGDFDNPHVREAITHTLAAARQAGKFGGIMATSIEKTQGWIDAGGLFLGWGIDVLWLQQELRAQRDSLAAGTSWKPRPRA